MKWTQTCTVFDVSGDDGQFNDGAAENGEPMINGESTEPNPRDIIRITGKPQNCELASQALKDSVPIEYKVRLPTYCNFFTLYVR